MKIKTILKQEKKKRVPPLVFEVEFETEKEMREFVRLIGPLPGDGPTDCFYSPILDHLEKYTGKR